MQFDIEKTTSRSSFVFLLASCFFLAPPSICIYLDIAPKSEKFAEKRQSIFLSIQNDSSISQKRVLEWKTPVPLPPYAERLCILVYSSRAPATRARIYPGSIVFLLSLLSHGSVRRRMSRIEKVVNKRTKHRGFAVTRRNKKARDSDFLLNPTIFTCIRLKNSVLHSHVTEVTDKNIKLLAIRACARAWERGRKMGFTLYNTIVT